jgi:hypothetical protein
MLATLAVITILSISIGGLIQFFAKGRWYITAIAVILPTLLLLAYGFINRDDQAYWLLFLALHYPASVLGAIAGALVIGLTKKR